MLRFDTLAHALVSRFDQDGDGRLQARELADPGTTAPHAVDLRKALRAHVPAGGLDAKGLAALMRDRLDRDGDGQLGWAERDGLAAALGATPGSAKVRTVLGGDRLHLDAVVPVVAPDPTGAPTVFLNHDETLTGRELGRTMTAIGRVLAPRAAAFTVSAAHANGNPASRLDLGVRLANRGTAPITVELAGREVGARGTAVGPTTRRVTLKAGASVDLPMATVGAHPGGNPRDAARMVTWRAQFRVTAGDPGALAVHDVAAFPAAGAAAPRPEPDATDKKHHEGVFQPQIQVSPPVLLAPGTAAALRIAGAQPTHDAHYDTVHTYYVAIPKGSKPGALVFRGGGGASRPLINGRLLPRAVGDVGAGGRDARGYGRLAERHEYAVPWAEAGTWLKATGQRDAAGNPVYRLDVTYLPGSNGDLGVYLRP